MIHRLFTAAAIAAMIPASAFLPGPLAAVGNPTPWTKEQASAWHQSHPWLFGCNYVPSTAVNDMEMWQAHTFDLATIDREFAWARQLG